MRLACAALVAALLVGGCSEKKAAAPAPDPKVAEASAKAAEQILKEEEDVFARREELSRERKTLREARAALAEKRKQAASGGGDVAAIEQEASDIEAKERALFDKESELNAKLDTLVSQYQQVLAQKAVPAGGGPAAEIAGREAGLATREKDVARREDRLAQRESELAARERAQALREKETCGTATTTVIQQVEPAKGSKYTKRDVEPVLQKARKRMNEKGLLESDLPAPAQALEGESVGAMKDGDYGKAKFAADQLYATVDSMKIDKGFIAAKIGRLNGLIKGRSVDGDKKKEVDELFRGATADYGDGKFAAANTKLNRIYALVR
jgi:hypothetical protein